jgi:hypothetical protein
MTVDYIRYDILTQDAMRSVVRTVMADAAAKGLPGEHHFFISFDTRADGVSLSPRIKAQYPKEMTIVLQHQFWDLVVGDDRFEVGLSFSGVAERLVIPFRAITGFADPSVQFGLQFAVTVDEDQADEEPAAEKPAERSLRVRPHATSADPRQSRPCRRPPIRRPIPNRPQSPPKPPQRAAKSSGSTDSGKNKQPGRRYVTGALLDCGRLNHKYVM